MRSVLPAFCCILALAVFGCSGMSPRSVVPFGNQPQVASFLGVRFGESLLDVQRRYPAGIAQTSPGGAPAYEIENASAGAIKYESVTYEFTAGGGMQLVLARFNPTWAADVYRQLEQSMGKPSKSNGVAADDASKLQASWQVPAGESVTFSGPAHSIVILGPSGESLQDDIRLRYEAES